MSNEAAKTTSNNPFDIFIVGLKKGLNIGLYSLLPNVVMAFVLTYILQLWGVMDFLGRTCGGIMGIFDLPGQAITVLLATWMSCGAGVGVVGAAGVGTQNHVLMAFLVDKMDVAMGIVFGHVGVIEACVPFGPEADADRAAGDIDQPVVHCFQGGRPVRARRGGRRLSAAARQKQAGRKSGGKCTVFHSAPPCF